QSDGFTTTLCPVALYANSHHDIQESLGYWSVAPPNVLASSNANHDKQSPTDPYALSAFNTTATATSFQWWPSTDNVAVNRYDIYRDGVRIAGGLPARIVFTDTGLQPATMYSYTIVAKDKAGNSSVPSAPLTVQTKSA